MSKLTYYLYQNIPGTHPSWSVACLGVNQADTDRHMRACWGRGCKRAGEVSGGGKVKADCGDVTAAAGEILAAQNS